MGAYRKIWGSLIWLSVLGYSGSFAAEPMIGPNERVALVGDSITQQNLYTKYIEAYVLACAGQRGVTFFQFGWGGETTHGFLGRMECNLPVFKPTLVTLCYGMNDGGCALLNPILVQAYEGGLGNILQNLQKMGIQKVLISSPGCVDPSYFMPGRKYEDGLEAGVSYNRTLAALRDAAKQIAQQNTQGFCDTFSVMKESMEKAKSGLGDKFEFCRDGVHPGPAGHLAMAYSFLKSMGYDGALAMLDVDMKGSAAGSSGHRIVSVRNGVVEVESSRFPFCFASLAEQAEDVKPFLLYLPFQQDLNRFVLKVRNLSTPKARVQWGRERREFTAAQLAQGVNLAQEFSVTPFDAAFSALLKSVARKQNYETHLIQKLVTPAPGIARDFVIAPEIEASWTAMQQQACKKWESLQQEQASTLKSVMHTIRIESIP